MESIITLDKSFYDFDDFLIKIHVRPHIDVVVCTKFSILFKLPKFTACSVNPAVSSGKIARRQPLTNAPANTVRNLQQHISLVTVVNPKLKALLFIGYYSR